MNDQIGWEPSEGPPSGRSKFQELFEWLDTHPGEWAVLHDVTTNDYSSLKKQRQYDVKWRQGDIYICTKEQS